MEKFNIFMALAGIISTIIAAAALYHSNHTFKENQKFIKKQQFESTFFNMMKQLEDIVNKLSLNETKGRDVFEFFYKKYMFTISSDNITQYVNEHRIIKHYTMVSEYDTDLVYLYEGIYDQPIIAGNGIENAINMIGVTGYEYIDNLYILDHYFRYLYRILRFVDEAVFLENNSNDIINERYKFTSILRATLSPYELVFIFYNGISKYGNEKTKPLIEKYSILKNIRTNLDAAIGALRPGGLLAYVTCSPHAAETKAIVRAALRRHAGLRALDTQDVAQRVAARPLDLAPGTHVQLWPHRHGTDAMFVQLLTVD